MVYSKTLTHDPAALDAVFAALAHDGRRQIVGYLATRADAPRMKAVAADNDMSPQLLNKHVAVLEKAGLVSRAMRGRERHLVLNADAFDAAQQWMRETRAFWERQFDSLQAYIAQLNDSPDGRNGPDNEAGPR